MWVLICVLAVREDVGDRMARVRTVDDSALMAEKSALKKAWSAAGGVATVFSTLSSTLPKPHAKTVTPDAFRLSAAEYALGSGSTDGTFGSPSVSSSATSVAPARGVAPLNASLAFAKPHCRHVNPPASSAAMPFRMSCSSVVSGTTSAPED